MIARLINTRRLLIKRKVGGGIPPLVDKKRARGEIFPTPLTRKKIFINLSCDKFHKFRKRKDGNLLY